MIKMAYPFKKIQEKWQKKWQEDMRYRSEFPSNKPKYYVLDMFPYPSGAGLHIGHPEGYTATDIVGRYKRAKGFNVLHPMGFDAFGLPTERYSMKTGIHPEVATRENIARFKEQLKSLGFAYDWEREINTTDPEYFKWTQWMFVQIYSHFYNHEKKQARPIEELEVPEGLSEDEKTAYIDSKRLAYTATVPVNWCEELGTVLANEEVEEWRSKGYTVEQRPMLQWMIRITEYADRLLKGLDTVDWPSSTADMQRNWIGKSTGAQIRFAVEGSDKQIEVFTTRPDTIFGATYMVLAPEHPLVDEITIGGQQARVEKYRKEASLKTDLERGDLNKDKSGVFTGAYAINPASGKKIPILIADYVLMGYGTGAIMAVPAHDERDFEFAHKLDLPIVQVVEQSGKKEEGDEITEAFSGNGKAINSSSDIISIDGQKTKDAKRSIIDWLRASGNGDFKINYRLRDWLFSRQRYWGEPIPIIHYQDGTKRALELDELPLRLPEVKEYKPAGTGESPLATVDTWVNYHDPKTGKMGKIETNTMPQWAGSCWYYLRYADPNNPENPIGKQQEKYWMGETGVDLYIGGAEHAVLHLLYARFWHKFLFDIGVVSNEEPVKKLFHQGLIMGEDGQKMSKSRGNVINPDDVVALHGSDAVRMYLMFLGPLEQSKPWSDKGIEGIDRFLSRAYRMIAGEEKSPVTIEERDLTQEEEYTLHTTIKKVTEDIENLSFNTAISQLMVYVNETFNLETKPLSSITKFVQLLAPFAHHLADELWEILGKDGMVTYQAWPEYDPAKTVKSTFELVIQVNSKIRAKVDAKKGITEEEARQKAEELEQIKAYIDGKEIRKVIFVKDKLLNYIVA
ncbi:MAG: leucine--tRNA ligase [Candidatus Kapaibacteriales bacterium]